MKLVYENWKSGFRVYEQEDGNAIVVNRETLARLEVFTHGLYESQRDNLDSVAIAYLCSLVHECYGSPYGDALIQSRPDPDNPLYMLVQYEQNYWPNQEPPV